MTVAYMIIPNLVYTLTFFQNMATNNILYISTTQHYVHTYASIIQISKYFPYKIILLITTLILMSGQILLCSSVLRTCTWKIVFKTQNNELNELNECMLYKMFCFSGKHLKTVKLSFMIIFQKPSLLTLLKSF